MMNIITILPIWGYPPPILPMLTRWNNTDMSDYGEEGRIKPQARVRG